MRFIKNENMYFFKKINNKNYKLTNKKLTLLFFNKLINLPC